MFNEKHCSPSLENKEISCLNYDLLLKIAGILNKYNYNIRMFKSKYALHKEISDKIGEKTDCETEKCWETISFLKSELSDTEREDFEKSFRPEKPESWKKNPNTWLSTVDINRVMEQYEDAYPNFQYLGANPIDFNKKIKKNKCVVDELCKLDIKSVKKDGKDCLGMVFNTDPHNESGEHWFSLYIDLLGKNVKGKPYIYYFDSLASKPKNEVVEFVKEVQEQCLDLNKDIKFLYNDIKHQHKNTECGVYCLHFLVSMLKGINFKNYISNKRNDQEMEKFRDIFFISK